MALSKIRLREIEGFSDGKISDIPELTKEEVARLRTLRQSDPELYARLGQKPRIRRIAKEDGTVETLVIDWHQSIPFISACMLRLPWKPKGIVAVNLIHFYYAKRVFMINILFVFMMAITVSCP